jgi:hypothetical protein
MSKLETNTIDNISGSSTLNIGDTNATAVTIDSGVSTVTIPNGAATGQNYPAFEANLSSSQTGLTSSTWTKMQFNTERFDTDNMYDNSTNYRFTPTVAGKYHTYLFGDIFSDTLYQANVFNVAIYKNGSLLYYAPNNSNPSYYENERTVSLTATIDMNGTSDYLEGYARVSTGSGTWSIGGASYSYFGAYRIGA